MSSKEHNSKRKPIQENCTIWCPCRFCSSCVRCYCKSSFQICGTCCCRPCVKPQGSTWNRFYAAAATVLHNTFYAVAENPSVWTGRFFLDNDMPTWSPALPCGVEIIQGPHLDMDPNLPSFEFIFPTHSGPPAFVKEEDRTYICK